MIWSDIKIRDAMASRIGDFEATQRRLRNGERAVSYGLSGSGYDVRLSETVLRQAEAGVLDPKRDNGALWTPTRYPESFTIAPGECVLGSTLEHIDMPDSVMALCIGKSTYARCGLLVNATPIEAGWRGHITLELSNVGRLPIRVYTGEGIAQLVFLPVDQRPGTTYNDRSGKYQDQGAAPVAARI